MKILCLGDVHLGQGSSLGRAPGDRLRDQADVLDRIADLATERRVDLILNAGDTFDGPAVPPEQLQLFAQFVARCHAESIPIVAITGNGVHDQAMRTTNGMDIFTHIPGIRVSSTPELIDVGDVTVATLPWVHPGRYVANHGADADREDVNSVVAGLLLEAARGLRAQIPEGRTAILLAHWSVSGTSLPNGLPVDDLREPVLPVEGLDDIGFDHVVLGHIHKAQEVGERGFYVGSPLPLNFGEDPDRFAHGVYIVDTRETEVIDAYAAEFVPIESRPLVTLAYDFIENPEVTMLDLFPPADSLDDAIVRVKYRATAEQARDFDASLLKLELHNLGAAVVRIEPEIVREDRARVEGVDESLDPLQALDLYIEANAVEPVLAVRMRERMSHYLNLVPA